MTPASPSSRRGLSLTMLVIGMVVAATTFAAVWTFWAPAGVSVELPPNLVCPVSRGVLDVVIRTAGEIDSTTKTNVVCELTQFSVYSSGSRRTSSGLSTILRLVPEGTLVRKGDVICELDSSEYVEMELQQTLEVEESRFELRQAELDLEVAEAARHEFLDGLAPQTLENYQGQLALAESDQVRLVDRVEWTKRMVDRGYMSLSQLRSEERNLAKAQLDVQRILRSFQVYRDYTIPRQRAGLEASILSRKSIVESRRRRLVRHENRLEQIRQMIANCTIRAPHDGMVIYANDDPDRPMVEGAQVYTNQKLFFLPDLEHMEAVARLNESVVHQVKPGMKARVRTESMPDRTFIGVVSSVDEFPEPPVRGRPMDVKTYKAHIKLDGGVNGLLPGMNSEIEIVADQSHDALVIPATALTQADGREACYVTQGDQVTIRPIRLGRSNTQWIEVVDGLSEGESVVIDSQAIAPEVASTIPLSDPSPVVTTSVTSDLSDRPNTASLGSSQTPTVSSAF